jgi:hypothetical protein
VTSDPAPLAAGPNLWGWLWDHVLWPSLHTTLRLLCFAAAVALLVLAVKLVSRWRRAVRRERHQNVMDRLLVPTCQCGAKATRRFDLTAISYQECLPDYVYRCDRHANVPLHGYRWPHGEDPVIEEPNADQWSLRPGNFPYERLDP